VGYGKDEEEKMGVEAGGDGEEEKEGWESSNVGRGM